jgi:hypothetical protein
LPDAGIAGQVKSNADSLAQAGFLPLLLPEFEEELLELVWRGGDAGLLEVLGRNPLGDVVFPLLGSAASTYSRVTKFGQHGTQSVFNWS